MSKLESLLDRIVTGVETRVNWRPVWASRLLGCTVGLLRLIEWPLDGFTLRLAWAMWQARYWTDWYAAYPHLREEE